MIYALTWLLAVLVLKFSFFLRVRGARNCRDIHGGFLIVCNHRSNWDPIVLGMSVRGRPVWYLAKEELFRRPLARFFLTRLHAIPIARGAGDIGAVKTALKALREGKILGMFPEGTRTRDNGGLQPFESGAALLALRSKVPVVPAYIKGRYKFWHRVTITYGAPIDLSALYPGRVNSQQVEQATGTLYEAMKKLAHESETAR